MNQILSLPGDRRPSQGFSLIEMLIALSILGILIAIGAMSFGSQGARAYSNDVRALIQQARFEAVKLNTPIAVVWNQGEQEFRSLRYDSDSSGPPCEGPITISRANFKEYRGVVVEPGFDHGDGIVWIPSGQARSCSMGAFTPTIARVSDRQRSLEVTVSLTGRVTIE